MTVCIYGASSTQLDTKYIDATECLGEELARAGYDMVYGGGCNGMMGAAARGIKKGGGRITGVVPHFLQVDGILYDGCDEMVYTETMRQRKQIMDDRADAFIVTPGGIGTYEEFFEMYTLKQLGQHEKKIILYNIAGFYDKMLAMLRYAVDEGFMKEKSLSLFTVATTPGEALAQLAAPKEEAFSLKDTKFI